jgi:membrane protease YdiL (CAAX protease family)
MKALLLVSALAAAVPARGAPFAAPQAAPLMLEPPPLARAETEVAETDAAPTPSPSPASGGGPTSDFWLPMGSLVVPGLGQYVHGDPRAGLAFTATAFGGILAGSALIGDEALDDVELTTSSPREQWGLAFLSTGQSALFLSAYDSFHRAVPELQRRGEYGFLTHHEPTERLFTAPSALSYAKRRTTWIPMGLAAALATAVVIDGRHGHDRFRPYHEGDELFVAGISYNAGVAEEALFRGYVLPLAQRRMGSFWAANGTQAVLFGALHYEAGGSLPIVQTLSALYDGWLTRHNGGSVRESIFQHFWYDVLVLTATLLADPLDEPKNVSVRFSVSF